MSRAGRTKTWINLAVALLMGGTLAACSSAPPPAPLPPAPVAALDPDAACLNDLAALGAVFQPVQSFSASEQGCGIANAVKISASPAAWSQAGILTCSMARTLVRFEAEVIQPAAQAKFGQSVKRIHHAGTYDCRTRRTEKAVGAGASRGGRLSEHAKGLAIDVTGFELADGSLVSVKKDWRGAGIRSGFLQEVARASCSRFKVVLTPNHDRLHQDHLHLDIGAYTLCGY